MAGWVVASVVVVALLVGGVIGYLAGLPAKNDLNDDKQALEASLASTQASLDQTRGDLEDTEAELAAAGLAAEAASVCREAADDADALIGAWIDLSADIDAWWVSEPGSVEEEELGIRIDDQLAAMADQDDAVQEELEACRDAMRVA